jgi:hypothetical protein
MIEKTNDDFMQDDITCWLRDQDEMGCHEAADEIVRLRAAAIELLRQQSTKYAIEHEPGELIARVHCPCCGAALSIKYGDNDGEIGVVGPHSSAFMRDPDCECTDYKHGEPTNFGLCDGDGHYMCRQCKNYATRSAKPPEQALQKWSGRLETDDGDVYVCTYDGDIYKQTDGCFVA